MPKYNGDTIQAKMCAGVDTDDELNIIRTSDDGAVHTYLNGQEAAIEVEGTVSVDNFPATQDVNIASQESPLEVEGTVSVDNLNGLTDVELRATPVETIEPASGNASTTSVTVTDSGVTVLAANVDRLGGLISNPGATDVYISFGTSPATTSMHRLSEKGVIPIGRYTGAIYGITASGSQGVAVTEFEA